MVVVLIDISEFMFGVFCSSVGIFLWKKCRFGLNSISVVSMNCIYVLVCLFRVCCI